MAKTKLALYDGEQISFYKEDALSSVLSFIKSKDGDIQLQAESAHYINLKSSLLLESNLYIRSSNGNINLGYSGDTVNLNVSGVTYNIGTLTGSPVFTGNITAQSASGTNYLYGTTNFYGTVNFFGANLNIEATTLTVDDKNIELASVSSPSDAIASGGGITLKGTTDKTIIWNNDGYGWTFNESIKLDSNKTLRLGGQIVSTLVTGTSPFSIASTTVVTNLNADLLDGNHASAFQPLLTNPVTGTGTQNYVAKWNNAGGTSIGNSVIYDDGTNVGIGTTNPVGKLQVLSTATAGVPGAGAGTAINGLFLAGDANGTYGLASGVLTTGAGWLQAQQETVSASTYPLLLNPNGGNVGIGTTNPTRVLTLNMTGGGYLPTGILFQSNGTGVLQIGHTTTGYLEFAGLYNNENIAIMPNGTGNVGIGTTNPGTKLEIKGSGNTFATTNFKLTNSDGTTIFTVQDHSVGKFSGQFQILGGAGSNQLYLDAGNASIMGNVGIGTTNPIGNLQLGSASNDQLLIINGQNNSTSSSVIRFGDGSTNPNYSMQLRFDSSNNRFFIEGDDNNDAVFEGYTTFLRNGNVGIGTTNPGSKLDINVGTASAAGRGVAARIWGAKAVNGSQLFIGDTAAMATGVGGKISFGGYKNGTTAEMFASIEGMKENATTDNYSGSLVFKTIAYPSNEAEVMRLTSTGNVGIGTTDPGATLQIGQNEASDTTAYGLRIFRKGTMSSPGEYSTTPMIHLIDISGDGPSSVDTSGHFFLQYPRIADTDTYAENATLFQLANDTGTALRISGKRNVYIGYSPSTISNQTSSLMINGNVGIGTTAPTHKFVIEQTVNDDVWQKIKSFDARISGIMLGETEGTGGVINRGFDIYHDGASNLLKIDAHNNTDAGTNVLTITRDLGNVGIGTTNPLSKLHVKAGADQNFRINSGTTLTFSAVNDADSAYAPLVMRASKFDFENGNVGIGTVSPEQKMQVVGKMSLGQTTGESETLSIKQTAGGENILRIKGSGGAEILFLSNSGYLGIGTTAPTEVIEANGSIKANLFYTEKSSLKTGFSLASYYTGTNTTGYLIIQTAWLQDENPMVDMDIDIYRYSDEQGAKIHVYGYLTTESNGGFRNFGYETIGAFQPIVRFARNTSTGAVAVIIGESSTYWALSNVSVSRASYSRTLAANINSWSISVNADISGYSNTDSLPNKSKFTTPYQITSTIATGTSPLSVTSTTLVTNLNADLLDGNHSSAFAPVVHTHLVTRKITVLGADLPNENTNLTIPDGASYVMGANKLEVYVNGVYMYIGHDYNEYSTTAITFFAKLPAGTKIMFRIEA